MKKFDKNLYLFRNYNFSLAFANKSVFMEALMSLLTTNCYIIYRWWYFGDKLGYNWSTDWDPKVKAINIIGVTVNTNTHCCDSMPLGHYLFFLKIFG